MRREPGFDFVPEQAVVRVTAPGEERVVRFLLDVREQQAKTEEAQVDFLSQLDALVWSCALAFEKQGEE